MGVERGERGWRGRERAVSRVSEAGSERDRERKRGGERGWEWWGLAIKYGQSQVQHNTVFH